MSVGDGVDRPHANIGAWGRTIARLSEWFALAGSAIFVAIAGMSVLSISGRALFDRPLSGDYELVQTGCAVFVSLCLPLCQVRGSNIIIDFFTAKASTATQRRLDAFGALLLGGVMLLVSWRLVVGTISIREAGETTTILAWPVWFTYAAMIPGVVLTSIAGFHSAIVHLRAARAR